jgi:hypothetical protein
MMKCRQLYSLHLQERENKHQFSDFYVHFCLFFIKYLVSFISYIQTHTKYASAEIVRFKSWNQDTLKCNEKIVKMVSRFLHVVHLTE